MNTIYMDIYDDILRHKHADKSLYRHTNISHNPHEVGTEKHDVGTEDLSPNYTERGCVTSTTDRMNQNGI